MNFKEAIKELGIEEYGERIFNSNSRGELLHLFDYISIAHNISGDKSWFKEWFKYTIKYAEKNWSRPESVFQHIPRMMKETIKYNTKRE